MSKTTIKEISKISGLSTATVDRVLNQRPGVRAVTIQKVKDAMVQLQHQAAGLGEIPRHHIDENTQNLDIHLIFPIGDNPFLEELHDKILSACATHPRFQTHQHPYPSLNEAALLEQLQATASDQPQVFVVVGLNTPLIKKACQKLQDQGHHLISLVSEIHGVQGAQHIGIDDHAAGRTAGFLISKVAESTTGSVAVFTGSINYLGHQQRESGFRNALREYAPQRHVIDSWESGEHPNDAYSKALGFFKSQNDLGALYIIGGGASQIIKAFREVQPQQTCTIVCHDKNKLNELQLLQGDIDFIIHQSPKDICQQCLQSLEDLSQQQPLAPHFRKIQIQILTKENDLV